MRRTFVASVAMLVALALASPGAAQTTQALQIAVMQNDPAAIDQAIRAGASASAMGENGSMLAIAAMMGRARSVRALLEHGADPAMPGPNGGNALSAAFFALNGVVLLGRDEAPDPRRRAEAVEIVRMIAARKSGLDIQMRIGPTMVTPLMEAASAGAADVVQILLDAGANPNAVNGGRYTALDYAVDRPPSWVTLPAAQRVEVVRLLLAKGARRDRAGADGVTPLARARAVGDPAIIALLEGR